MEYGTFKEEFRKRLQEELGEEAEVSFQSLERNNGRKEEGMEVRRKGCTIAPVLHLDKLYQDYQESGSLQGAVGWALKLLEEKPPVNAVAVPKTWSAARGNIRPELVNYGWNRERLGHVPHRKFLDLAVTYRFEFPGIRDFQTRIRITDSLMEVWGAKEEELYQEAMKGLGNERFHIQPIAELMGGLSGKPSGEESEHSEDMKQPYVLTNSVFGYGAAGMLRQDLMEEFAKQAGGSFYILPSSIHDLILLPDEPSVNVECLKEMVKEVNKSEVAREEWLSEDVYYYDNEEKKVRMSIGDKSLK